MPTIGGREGHGTIPAELTSILWVPVMAFELLALLWSPC